MSTLNVRSEAVDSFKKFIKGETSESLEAIARRAIGEISPEFLEKDTALDYTSDRTLRNSRELAKSKLINTFLGYVDLPSVFQNVATSILIKKWANDKGTWRNWVSNIPLENFIQSDITSIGVLPEPTKVSEGSNFNYVNLYGERATANLSSFGDIFNIGRGDLLNSNPGTLQELITAISSCFDCLVSTQVYNLLSQNPVCFEDRTLFHEDHNNQVVKTGDYEKDLESALGLMFGQKISADGKVQQLNIQPRFVIAPASESLALSKVLVDYNSVVSETQRIQLVIEPRLSGGGSWYLACDKETSSIRTFTLEGSEAPTIQTKEYHQRNGMDVKYRFDIDVEPVDYRGLVQIKQAA